MSSKVASTEALWPITQRRCWHLLCALCLVITFSIVYVLTSANGLKPIIVTHHVTKSRPYRMTIITWNHLHEPNNDWLFTEQMQQYCPEMTLKCKYTQNRSMIEESEMILFHMRAELALPKKRNYARKWVFVINESMTHTYLKLSEQQNRYNATMSFKRGSDIPYIYGECWRLSDEQARAERAKNKTNHALGKTKLAAWFVSNCNAPSKRDDYAKELQKHMAVDIYGNCGPLKCAERMNKDCYEKTLQKNYKFYLAFENSLCAEYITEKAWNVLQLYVVPIVLGGAAYNELLPPHSYIDVRDFKSPQHLAEYLKVLDKNDTLYNEYFDWKQTYKCGEPRVPAACSVCEFAHKHREDILKPPDVEKFWGEKQNCFAPADYYKGHM